MSLTPTFRAILACHAASNEVKHAHDALTEIDPEGAQLLHQAGEQILVAIGRIVRGEAARRAATVLGVAEVTS